ncbi:protein SERAC1 [Anticarsia gemmatalis]|uniref:protein SERAC1 n=1 Tax=Anticarsia gemmatalis TaxID=129554 RepID=UPI003F76D396
MTINDRLKGLVKFLKTSTIWGGTTMFLAYHIGQTYKAIGRIVNPKVLDREKQQAEYIYVDDPLYNVTLKLEQDRESKQSVGLARIWKSLKYSLAWKLLWLCRHGNKDQRNLALEQLAAFKNNKIWDCCKLAQALDKNTAVLLARTRGVDLRYFLPPPIHVRRAALTSELLSFKLRDLIIAVQSINPHYCIQHFIFKYFTHVQEQAMDSVEADSIPSKPDSISERDLCILCLDALYHHVSLFYTTKYEEDVSIIHLMNKGLMSILAEAMLRYRDDPDFDLAVLRILTVLSVHSNLLLDFFQNGMIRELCRLLRSSDVRLSSSAAVSLANLSGEQCYRPGLYLLHPIYRTTTPPSCDTLLVHGLRGGVFVTWRQRDKKCAEPIGIIEVTMTDSDCPDPSCESPSIPEPKYFDPDLQQVMEDLIEIDDEATLADLEVVLHDVPIQALREPPSLETYLAKKKRLAMIEEEQDKCSYTFCWPRDWLPKDCCNLRILGVNYWSSLSEWLERCPSQSADICKRASDMVPALIDAGVGIKDTGVVWLAHSMGGLIVKQALVESSQSNDDELKRLSENTKAVLFFSTPHKGSALATMPRAAAAVLWPSNDVRQLQENSPTLLELHKEFIKYANIYNWETVSFAETMPTLVTAFKVPVHFVQTYSADLGRGVFYELPLDHLSICKPATRQSVLYTTVLDVLKRACVKEIELEEPFIRRLVDLLVSIFKDRIRKLIDVLDETQNSDGLRWIERLLLDSHTDDFTD